MEKENFLIAEYTSIAENFRIYQSNRLNLILLAITAVGAIMLNGIENDYIIQLFSLLLLYIIIGFLVVIDKIFMNRLRKYTLRLSEIEKKFQVTDGYATTRLKNPERKQDATTKTIRHLIQTLTIIIGFFSIFILIRLPNNIIESIKLEYGIILIPIVLTALLYYIVTTQVNTKHLDITR
ncbi:hypothetical protein LB467_10170 [Salegentibacter sp. JZCK2]|uniref:hypothetical protein n=1 Tax=Salegentibacter tibetensis TaxID=2873600 RepID=UPI001CCDE0C0|nr:hypothetical protein [Salegentibacter tibetensis]MBZ9730051.1 hypothetical protein [Salegentibacter tibetensis]